MCVGKTEITDVPHHAPQCRSRHGMYDAVCSICISVCVWMCLFCMCVCVWLKSVCATMCVVVYVSVFRVCVCVLCVCVVCVIKIGIYDNEYSICISECLCVCVLCVCV
jgi:hypothetical protein